MAIRKTWTTGIVASLYYIKIENREPQEFKDIQILAGWMTPASGEVQFLCTKAEVKTDLVFSHLPLLQIHEFFPFLKIIMMTKKTPQAQPRAKVT